MNNISKHTCFRFFIEEWMFYFVKESLIEVYYINPFAFFHCSMHAVDKPLLIEEKSMGLN